MFRPLANLLPFAPLLMSTIASAQTQNPSFNLVDRGPVPVRELYVTPAGDANWGKDRLEGRPIASGASFAVRRRIDGNCVFDIRAVFADNRIEDRRGINTCTTDSVIVGEPARAAGKDSADLSFKLVNHHPTAITEFFATPPGQDRGANRIDSDIAPQAGRAIAITRSGGCVYDLRVVFADHKALEKKRSDLCRTTDLTVP